MTAGWRYRVAWVPVAEPAARPVLSGTWLVVVPAGEAGGELAAGCVRALAACGAQVEVAEAAPGEIGPGGAGGPRSAGRQTGR